MVEELRQRKRKSWSCPGTGSAGKHAVAGVTQFVGQGQGGAHVVGPGNEDEGVDIGDAGAEGAGGLPTLSARSIQRLARPWRIISAYSGPSTDRPLENVFQVCSQVVAG